MDTFWEPGRYRVKIVGACLGESKSSGTPQVEIGIQVEGLYTNGTLHRADGPDRTVYLSLTEGTLGSASEPGWVWQTLTDLGFVGPTFADLQPLVGQVRDAQMETQEYNGSSQEKWSIYRRRGSTAMRPAEPKTVRQLGAKFGGLLKTVKPTRPQPQPEPKMQEEAQEAEAPPATGWAPPLPSEPERTPVRQMAEGLAGTSPAGSADDIPF